MATQSIAKGAALYPNLLKPLDLGFTSLKNRAIMVCNFIAHVTVTDLCCNKRRV